MAELKQCPFCGGKAELGTASVFCTNEKCGAMIWAPLNPLNIDGAIEAWEIRNDAENRALRNELCLKCGRYHEAHKGACDGCRWRENNYGDNNTR